MHAPSEKIEKFVFLMYFLTLLGNRYDRKIKKFKEWEFFLKMF